MPNHQAEEVPQPHPPEKEQPIEFKDEPPPEVTADENEGEGNRTADRNDREGVKRHPEKGDTEKEAREAEEAPDEEDEKLDLEDAEEAARKGRIH